VLSVLGEATRQFAGTLRTISGGTTSIKILEAGWAAATPDLLDAVSDGTVDAAFTSPIYAAAKVPALALYAGVPFGPSADDYLAWLVDGEGGRLHRELYARLGVHAIPCGLVGSEAGGWFRNELNSVADFKGLRLRYNGVGGKIVEKLGAISVPTPPGELFFKLQQGKLDGTEFSMPSVDRAVGFDKLGLIYYFPGWHQPAAVLDFYMKKDKWDALNLVRRAQIETACRSTIAWTLARAPAEQVRAMEYFRNAGVTIRTWQPEVLDALRAAAADVIADEALHDPDYKIVWENMSAFLEGVRGWSKLSRP
jgi:TRAP-type mannitol/chloroaromatic compound transport system substrate-binding protein